ncbi:hypothetical protein MPF19_08725 [Polaribacter sp. Z014]|uniref:hypothetical protein n=1 Tax=Polaribacter sp. Z014 TaxID=2927126 RepID=UPI002021BB81|nr:hypothetical protein [Polaribacter sp. Z014]MCL7763494.1 hypothetical protein [Polaribacter sp. Z014]
MKTNYLKLAVLGLIMMAGTAMNAQSTADQTKDTKAIRVIDNKGTIKYLQSNNGITSITNTSADVTTTTWQLGGTLSDNTYINTADKVFALDNLQLVTTFSTASTNTNAELNDSDHDDDAAAGSTGWTVLIRDEDSGELKKIRVSDLLQVTSGQQIFEASGIAATIGTNTVTDMPADNSKVSAYRNGAKLLAGVDYTLAAGVLILVDKSAVTTSQGWTLYPADDVVEVHWIK